MPDSRLLREDDYAPRLARHTEIHIRAVGSHASEGNTTDLIEGEDCNTIGWQRTFTGEVQDRSRNHGSVRRRPATAFASCTPLLTRRNHYFHCLLPGGEAPDVGKIPRCYSALGCNVPAQIETMYAVAGGAVRHHPHVILPGDYPPLVGHWGSQTCITIVRATEKRDPFAAVPAADARHRMRTPGKCVDRIGLTSAVHLKSVVGRGAAEKVALRFFPGIRSGSRICQPRSPSRNQL